MALSLPTRCLTYYSHTEMVTLLRMSLIVPLHGGTNQDGKRGHLGEGRAVDSISWVRTYRRCESTLTLPL
jgi:hypothetical protein